MLERSRSQEFPEGLASDVRFIDIDRLLGALARQWRVIAACIGIGLALGILYLSLTPRSYFASSEILIDQNQPDLVPNDVTAQTSAVTIENEVLNEMEVLQSSRIARAVVEAEHLDTDPAFVNPPASFTGRIAGMFKGLLGASGDASVASIPVDLAVQMLMKGITVDRVGRSSALVVGYAGSTPELAFRVANALAQAFVKEQLNTDATTQAATWLQQQLTQLGESRRQAAEALQTFRQQSGRGITDDQSLASQRLQALGTQLVTAQSDTAHARALSAQLQAAVAQGPAAAGANAMLLTGADQADPKTTDLVTQYSSTVQRLNQVTAEFGPNHPQVAVLQRTQAALAGQIFTLLKQLNDRYANDLSVAEGREASLRQDLKDEGAQTTADNASRVHLDELQQKASALELLYNSFLSRYEETLQRQSFPITSARVITAPVLPKTASSPKILVVALGSILFGAFLGLCFATLNEMRERSFRLGAQVTRELGAHFIGYLPDLRARGHRKKAHAGAPEVQDLIRGQVLSARSNMTVTALTETLKSSKMALNDRRHAGRATVLGVTSVLPGEGKTTYAVAFAETLAASGSKVLLIDADLRHPAASRLTAPSAVAGLLDAVEGRSWRELVLTDRRTGLAILPASTSLEEIQITDPLTSTTMGQLLREARDSFDYVIIDLPPLSPMVDALSVLPWTDGFMLVVEWGRTPRRLVRAIIEREPQLENALVGVVLNKVNFDRLARYSESGDSERYIRAYESYYRVHAQAER